MSTGLVLVCALALPGCVGVPDYCGTEARAAVIVELPEGAQVARVTAERANKVDCDLLGDDTYACYEQGEGTYEVRVYAYDQVFTKAVHIEADACHVTEQKRLVFDL